MKKLFLLAILVALQMNAQTNHTSIMLGYKSIEVSASHTIPCELSFGLALSVTDAQIVEKRANHNETNNYTHKFKSDIVPAAFLLVGGQFDNFTIVGKMGGAYLEQDINNRPESKKYYYAVGVIFDYRFENNTSIRASYDNVSGPMVGVGFNF